MEIIITNTVKTKLLSIIRSRRKTSRIASPFIDEYFSPRQTPLFAVAITMASKLLPSVEGSVIFYLSSYQILSYSATHTRMHSSSSSTLYPENTTTSTTYIQEDYVPVVAPHAVDIPPHPFSDKERHHLPSLPRAANTH